MMEAPFEDALAFLRGDVRPKVPVKVRHYMGGNVKDVIWTDYAAPIIVGPRVVQVLADEYLDGGWRTYPVEVYGRDGRVIEGYEGFAIVGRCGRVQNSRSEVVFREFPGGSFPVRRGMFFDPNSWDGSPIFMPRGDNAMFVTDDVRKSFERARIKNVRFDRLSEIERIRS